MNAIIKKKDEDQFANGQNSRDLRVSPDARELETQLMEAIDNIGDFLRFVDRSNKSEIMEEFYARCRHQTSRRRPAPCDRTNSARLRWRRGLTLIFGLAGKAEAD
jgi:hypothetical protein